MDRVDAKIPVHEAVEGPRQEIRPPNCETLLGLPPHVTQPREGAFLFSYGGMRLTREGAQPGSVHFSRVELPWSGKAILFQRVSPGHEAQDSLSLLVDKKHRLVGWAKSDGVTIVPGPGQNKSAFLSDLVTHGIADVLPKGKKGESLKDWSARWRQAAALKLKQISSNFRSQGLKGAATADYGLVVVDDLPRKGRAYRIGTVKVGSVVSADHQKSGDFGGYEIWQQNQNGNWAIKPGWEKDSKRSFVGSQVAPERPMRHRGILSQKQNIALLSFTDGIKSVAEGKTQKIANRTLPELLGGWVDGDLDVNKMKVFLNDPRFVSANDDVSLVMIGFPANTKTA